MVRRRHHLQPEVLSRDVQPEQIAALRMAMVANFNSLELMIGQLPHEGARPQTVRNTKELRGRMIHLLPVIDALDDRSTPLSDARRNWWKSSRRC
jgi:hypothetical protein